MVLQQVRDRKPQVKSQSQKAVILSLPLKPKTEEAKEDLQYPIKQLQFQQRISEKLAGTRVGRRLPKLPQIGLEDNLFQLFLAELRKEGKNNKPPDRKVAEKPLNPQKEDLTEQMKWKSLTQPAGQDPILKEIKGTTLFPGISQERTPAIGTVVLLERMKTRTLMTVSENSILMRMT